MGLTLKFPIETAYINIAFKAESQAYLIVALLSSIFSYVKRIYRQSVLFSRMLILSGVGEFL